MDAEGLRSKADKPDEFFFRSRMGQRGLFIVLEGLDRSGKTTQVARLEQSIRSQGKPCRVQKFPGV